MTRGWVCLWAALCTACAPHTIAVFAPPGDVPPSAHVVAAITPGKVTELANARIRGGVVEQDGRRVLELRPGDVVVVRAGDGQRLGPVAVQRDVRGYVLQALGVGVAAGGTLASTVVAVACAADHTSGSFAGWDDASCAGVGLAGAAVFVAAGVGLFLLGSKATLRVVRAPLSLSF